MTAPEDSGLEFAPVTRDRWADLQRLFARSAATGDAADPRQCWCMEWRLERSQWEVQLGEGNRRAMGQLIDSGEVPGILAYRDGEPAGWCSISPRRGLTGLRNRAQFRSPESEAFWSIVCFFVPESERGKGVMTRLLQAAVAHAAENGAEVVEAYPGDAELRHQVRFMGRVEAFREAGFVEHARAREHQYVMRYYVTGHER